jgi:hypothetical protein
MSGAAKAIRPVKETAGGVLGVGKGREVQISRLGSGLIRPKTITKMAKTTLSIIT